MPVRFQVDPDFYDHPKVTGMSDSAFALWVRAGSYSAAKSTDGFVSEDVLAHTLRYGVDVADELVQRGLWRRRRGGFQFHQWDSRNLTKERIEADREADRVRKRIARGRSPVEEEGQVNGHSVRTDSKRNPEGVQEESGEIPPVSVSVSMSVSESQPPNPPKGGRGKNYAYSADEVFARFWSAFPKKAGKAPAYSEWLKALGRGADPERIIHAAEQYRDDPHRNPNKTKYPQGWLSDERYLDEPVNTNGTRPKGWWDN